MAWFGFDFNGDGTVSLGEQMISLDMMGFFDDEKQRGSSKRAFEDEFDEGSDDPDGLNLEGKR